MYKVNGELFSCDITDSGIVLSREGDIQNFAWLVRLNGLSKFAQNFTVGFLKLLSTHPIHIVVWGNFPFKFCKCVMCRFKEECMRYLPQLIRAYKLWVSNLLFCLSVTLWHTKGFHHHENYMYPNLDKYSSSKSSEVQKFLGPNHFSVGRL